MVSFAKTASTKTGILIRFMKLILAEVALYLPKSTIRLCMEYCCHAWASTPSCCRFRNRYAGLLLLHLQFRLNSWLIV